MLGSKSLGLFKKALKQMTRIGAKYLGSPSLLHGSDSAQPGRV